MQVPLPGLPPSFRPVTPTVSIDYAHGTIRPNTLEALATILGRTFRYGVHAPVDPRKRCSVLVHSVLVGRVLGNLAIWDSVGPMVPRGPGILDPISSALPRAYGCLHDAGETLGGDVVAMLDPRISAPLRAYQHAVRDRIVRRLGFPLPNSEMKSWISLVDRVVVLVEAEAMGIQMPPEYADQVLVPLLEQASGATGPITPLLELIRLHHQYLRQISGAETFCHADMVRQQFLGVFKLLSQTKVRLTSDSDGGLDQILAPVSSGQTLSNGCRVHLMETLAPDRPAEVRDYDETGHFTLVDVEGESP